MVGILSSRLNCGCSSPKQCKYGKRGKAFDVCRGATGYTPEMLAKVRAFWEHEQVKHPAAPTKKPRQREKTPYGVGDAIHEIAVKLNLAECVGCRFRRDYYNHQGIEWCEANKLVIVAEMTAAANSLSLSEWFGAAGRAALAGYTSMLSIVEDAIEKAKH
jgi:hypothetical protein